MVIIITFNSQTHEAIYNEALAELDGADHPVIALRMEREENEHRKDSLPVKRLLLVNGFKNHWKGGKGKGQI